MEMSGIRIQCSIVPPVAGKRSRNRSTPTLAGNTLPARCDVVAVRREATGPPVTPEIVLE